MVSIFSKYSKFYLETSTRDESIEFVKKYDVNENLYILCTFVPITKGYCPPLDCAGGKITSVGNDSFSIYNSMGFENNCPETISIKFNDLNKIYVLKDKRLVEEFIKI